MISPVSRLAHFSRPPPAAGGHEETGEGGGDAEEEAGEAERHARSGRRSGREDRLCLTGHLQTGRAGRGTRRQHVQGHPHRELRHLHRRQVSSVEH